MPRRSIGAFTATLFLVGLTSTSITPSEIAEPFFASSASLGITFSFEKERTRYFGMMGARGSISSSFSQHVENRDISDQRPIKKLCPFPFFRQAPQK